MMRPSPKFDRWTPWHPLAAFALSALALAATWPAWQDIYHIACVDEENSQIWLAPVVAVAMVFVRRSRLPHTRPVGMMIGPIIAALGWLAYTYGFYYGVQSLFHGGAVLVVLGAALSVLGRHVFFRFLPAMAVLIFLVPVPGRIRLEVAQPLQNWTSRIAEASLLGFGVDVQRSGNALWVDGKQVNIVEACNGLRMVFGLILVSYAFAFGLPVRNWVRVLVLAASPLAALACNVVRVIPTAWICPHVAETTFAIIHDTTGWLMLPIAFGLLFAVLKALQWAMVPVMRYTLASQDAGRAPTFELAR